MIHNLFNFDEIKNYLVTEIDIVFTGNKSDPRSQYIMNNLPDFKGISISLEIDKNFDILDIILKNHSTGSIKTQTNQVLVTSLRKMLKEMNVYKNSVCIDITSIDNVIYFLLIKILLTEINPKLLFVAYTEPEKYVRDESDYQLSENILGLRALPGFAKRSTGSKKLLVPLLGFERQRLPSLVDDIEAGVEVVPVIGFPNSTPGWKLIAERVNSRALAKLNCLNKIRTVEAINPFGLFNLLKEISKQNEDSHMLIAPLGIRPFGLGAAIYASINTHCTLIYDFPIEKKYRSEGILKSNIYNLSSYIQIK